MSERPNELPLALAQLERLFIKADRQGRYPHEVDLRTFYDAWSVVNRQPLSVRQDVHTRLMRRLTNPRFRFLIKGTHAKPRPQ